PERDISTPKWNEYGHGYMLMPDPRSVGFGGEMIFGWNDGTSSAIDEYGRRPWEPECGGESMRDSEFQTLQRFKGEFARLHGPTRRGRSFRGASLDNEVDSEEFHQYHLSLDKKRKRKR
ncbi:MAG: hypothetical protein ABIP54_00440, partial [Candidatus Andersenbacteria bacterium]